MSDISNVLRKVIELDISLGLDGTQEALDEITRLTAEVEWHKKNSDKWQDTQAAHVREVTRLTAEVERLTVEVEAAKKFGNGFYGEKVTEGVREVYRGFARAALSGDKQ